MHVQNFSFKKLHLKMLSTNFLSLFRLQCVLNSLAPSQYPNQCWSIVNWDLGHKHQCNLNRNSWIFIQENAFENGVWKMASILFHPQCVNSIKYTFTSIHKISLQKSDIKKNKKQKKQSNICFSINSLRHIYVTYICISKLCHHWFR